MKRVLVTGATGFVGHHLLPALLSAGYSVRATCRALPEASESSAAVEWVQVAGIGPDTEWGAALNGIDLVIHLAGVAHRVGVSDQDLAEDFRRVNTEGTIRLADAIRQQPTAPKRLIFLSSAKAMALDQHGAACEGPPDSEYGRSKLAAETGIRETLAGSSCEWVILRPCVVYGPGNLGNMARLVRLIDTGLPLPFGSLRNRRSFIYVGNLVDAILAALEHPAAGRRTYMLSDGETISTAELSRRLGAHARHPARLFPMPVTLMKALARMGDAVKSLTGISPGWDSYSVDRLCSSLTVDAQPFMRDLAWTPPYSMGEGIRLTMTSSSASAEAHD